MEIVINYSPSCRSKAVRPSFIFETQFKIFLIKSKKSYSKVTTTIKVQKRSKDISKIVHVTSGVQGVILWSYDHFFVRKENKSNDYIQPLMSYGQF